MSASSTDELNQIEGGKIMPTGPFVSMLGPVTLKLPPNGGLGATGDGGPAGGGGSGFIWGSDDPKLPD
jgi:hypothetical protein